MSVSPRAMPHASLLAAAIVLALPAISLAQSPPSQSPEPAKPSAQVFDTLTIRGLQPTSLPTQVPTTIEGITGDAVRERINATDAEDALKYFPSLLVRKRYVGDYDHAVLATRASGTNNSARSLVYADGILLSNLLGNGATFTPRWGMVDPAEIERVDVLYGPFSAAYPGNSVGAAVDYVTRMPDRLEVHARAGYALERARVYGTRGDFPARTFGVSAGDRWGTLSAWLSVNRSDSNAHPISFATLPVSTGKSGAPATAVTGAIAGENPRGQPWYVVGASGQTHTTQDLVKLKLAWDIRPGLRLSYLVDQWHNDAERGAETYLRDANGTPVYSGNVAIDGLNYTLAATALPLQQTEMKHRMQGITLRQGGNGRWTWSLAASRYDYVVDRVRSPLVALPFSDIGGSGLVADSHGTGWTTFTARATWHPAAHTVEFGIGDDAYRLRTQVSSLQDWQHDAAGPRASAFAGTTRLASVFVQDTWRIAPRWTSMLGLRSERWEARDGLLANAATVLRFAPRNQSSLSPKAALEFLPSQDWSLKASIGRAVRFPTVSELYQGTIASGSIVNNDPSLRPERSVTSELSAIRKSDHGDVRATVFNEFTRDALYSQTDVTVVPNVTSIQNIDAIRTRGLELATHANDVGIAGLELDASLTWTDSLITRNHRFPASEGKWQPRVPRWRANLLATWRANDHWSITGGVRYSGQQYNTLDNGDIHSHAYTGTSPFLVADIKLHYRRDAHWSGAFGVDNLGNQTYWAFHPYNQRTWMAELRYDL